MNNTVDFELLSIVAPAFNEEDVIQAFYERTCRVLEKLDLASEIVFINDGSTDRTLEILLKLKKEDSRISIVDLSRNFGKEIALTAGLDHAKGCVAIPIDVDLQDPPELIQDMIVEWRKGYDVVYATRNQRHGENWLKKTTAQLFYRLMRVIGGRAAIPENTGDFRLMNRKALDAFQKMRERHRFLKGLFSVIGFKQTSVVYDRDPRFAGTTKWNYWRLWNLSIEGITSFTTAPLKAATYFGLLVAVLSLSLAVWTIYKTVVYGDPVAGYPSLMTAVLFLGSIQLIALGIIGEYLGRIFNETKQRPLYYLQDVFESNPNSREPINLSTNSDRLDRSS